MQVECKFQAQFYNKHFLFQNFKGVSNNQDEYAAIIMQGTGTYSIEAVMQALLCDNAKFLILENGLYGKKLASICEKLNIKYDIKSFPENRTINVNDVETILKNCKQNEYATIGMIHSETSSGVLNHVELIGPLVKKYLPSKLKCHFT